MTESSGGRRFNPRSDLERRYSPAVLDVMEGLARDAAGDTNYMQALIAMHIIKKAEAEVIDTQSGILRGNSDLAVQLVMQRSKLDSLRSVMGCILEQNPEINSAYSEVDRRLAGVSIARQVDGQSVNVANVVNAVASWGALLRKPS